MILQVAADTSQLNSHEGFGTFLIISEIVITAIIFIGVYFIFKPVFGKKEED